MSEQDQITIEPPHVLATLPKPFNATSGRRQCGAVWLLDSVAGKKRKRSEVAIAVDGEALNIYDTEVPSLVASYAVPPQAVFTCAPCSVRRPATEGEPARRDTYGALHGEKREIFLYSESNKSSSSVSYDQPPTMIRRRTLDHTESPVVQLHLLATSTETGTDGTGDCILLVHDDGTLQCLKQDLSADIWTVEPTTFEGPVCIEFSQIMSLEEGLSGLLRNREDIQIILSRGSSRSSALLLVVTRPRKDNDPPQLGRTAHLFIINTSVVSAALADRTGAARFLTQWDLPDSRSLSSMSPNDNRIILDALSGSLRCLFDTSIKTYDLTSIFPIISSDISFPGGQESTLLALYPHLILAASTFSLDVIDPKFNSLQASMPVERRPNEDLGIRKRSYREAMLATTIAPISLVSFDLSTSLVIGISGNSLITFHIDLKEAETSTLANSLGRARTKYSFSSTPFSGGMGNSRWLGSRSMVAKDDTDEYWQKIIEQLQSHAERGDVSSFEELIAKHLPINQNGYRKKDEKRLDRGNFEMLSNGQEPNSRLDAPKAFIPTSSSQTRNGNNGLFNDRIIIAALGQIFRLPPPTQDASEEAETTGINQIVSLEIIFFPPNVMRWLLDSGILGKSIITKAMKATYGVERDLSSIWRVGDLVNALCQYDADMQWLLHLLASPVTLDAAEIVHAVDLIMRSLGYCDFSPKQKLLTNGEDAPPLVNGDLDSALETEEDAAEMDIDDAFSALEGDGAIKEQALTIAMTRLGTFSSATIVQVIKKELSRDVIVELIHLLRMQLAGGGWLSLYQYAVEELDLGNDHQVSDHSISLISKLLNCALDSVGIGGWIFGPMELHDGEAVEDLVYSLQAEVSAALEGVEESTYLEGMLDGFLSYERSVQQTVTAMYSASSPKMKKKLDSKALRKIADETEVAALLPLSLKADPPLPTKRKGLNGEVRNRTARDKGRLRSLKVPRYSVDKIIV